MTWSQRLVCGLKTGLAGSAGGRVSRMSFRSNSELRESIEFSKFNLFTKLELEIFAHIVPGVRI